MPDPDGLGAFRADVYSLGATAFALLTGAPPDHNVALAFPPGSPSWMVDLLRVMLSPNEMARPTAIQVAMHPRILKYICEHLYRSVERRSTLSMKTVTTILRGSFAGGTLNQSWLVHHHRCAQQFREQLARFGVATLAAARMIAKALSPEEALDAKEMQAAAALANAPRQGEAEARHLLRLRGHAEPVAGVAAAGARPRSGGLLFARAEDSAPAARGILVVSTGTATSPTDPAAPTAAPAPVAAPAPSVAPDTAVLLTGAAMPRGAAPFTRGVADTVVDDFDDSVDALAGILEGLRLPGSTAEASDGSAAADFLGSGSSPPTNVAASAGDTTCHWESLLCVARAELLFFQQLGAADEGSRSTRRRDHAYDKGGEAGAAAGPANEWVLKGLELEGSSGGGARTPVWNFSPALPPRAAAAQASPLLPLSSPLGTLNAVRSSRRRPRSSPPASEAPLRGGSRRPPPAPPAVIVSASLRPREAPPRSALHHVAALPSEAVGPSVPPYLPLDPKIRLNAVTALVRAMYKWADGCRYAVAMVRAQGIAMDAAALLRHDLDDRAAHAVLLETALQLPLPQAAALPHIRYQDVDAAFVARIAALEKSLHAAFPDERWNRDRSQPFQQRNAISLVTCILKAWNGTVVTSTEHKFAISTGPVRQYGRAYSLDFRTRD